MAKGYDTNQQRKEALSLLGKDLARRAKSKCELTGESGVSLTTYEVPPVPSEPDFERCVMLSSTVIEALENPKKIVASEWRILGEQIWSDIVPVQIIAVRMLSYIAKSEHWAQEMLDNAYLDDAIVEQANLSPLA